MVRNNEMPKMGEFASLFARVIKEATEEAGISGSAVARKLGRAQSYASVRLNGRKAWTMDELDAIADLLGTTAFELMARVNK